MSHPDFELYDNVGRDAEQIAAARYGIASHADLLRWAERDAAPFLVQHPLPTEPLSAPDTAPYLAALSAAQTPAEAHAVTTRLLDAAEPALRAVSDYLLAAAQWRGQHRQAALGSPPILLREAASRTLSVLAFADRAGADALRAEYDPAPTPKDPTAHQSPGLPPAPPSPPPTGSKPSH
ncbi:hypothetical protein [Streptomyces buecherae]|uniref:hypothetical protein n=1 Tax=Streptomyces buecherae TaxID=2763006 RepID=UPI0027E2FA5B|nr:hypothetical protein [Streptomyces buecherae]